MSEPKTVGFLTGLGQGWAGQSPRRGSSFCSSIPAPGRAGGMPCGDPQGVVEGPTTATRSIQQLLWGCGDRVTPQTSPKPGVVQVDSISQPPRAGCWELAAPPSPGSLPTMPCTAPGLLHAMEGKGEEKNPTKVPLKLIVFIAGLTVSCKSFYDPAQEHQ